MNWVDFIGLIVLPPDPSGLPNCWQYDPSHRDPHGMRFRHPSGDILDFHIGRPGETGMKAIDHWHHNEGREHLLPGTEISGGACPDQEDKRTLREKIRDAWRNFNEFMQRMVPSKPPNPHYPVVPGPFGIPAPA